MVATQDMQSIYAMGTAGAELAERLRAAMMEYMGQSSAEFVDFVGARLKADEQVRRELLACRDPQSFAQIQANFLRDAMDDYTAETGKMLDLGAEAMAKIFDSAKA